MENNIDTQKKSKNNSRLIIGLIVGLICGVIIVIGGLVAIDIVKTLGCNSSNDEETEKKPVIYLYAAPSDKDHLDGQYTNIKLNLTDSELTTTYPKYNEEKGWNVIAKEDGTIYSDDYSQTYNYLYWEACNKGNKYDLSKGFCVEKNESSKFLEEVLSKLGLNRKEANEFIVYWLPELEKNEYNLITFQTERYTETHKLEITPTPDNMLRVYMTVTPLTERKEIEPQDLSLIKGNFKREGFTVVEWGGTIITR